MKTVQWFILALALSFNALAQQKEAIVMTVGEESVSLSEFEAIFRKNNQEGPVSKAELDEYMELFRIFKLKVYDARQQGLDTSQAFNRELQAYVKQLAKPFLRDTAAESQLVLGTWQRMQTDRQIRQIFIKLPACSDPSDTLRAYHKMEDIRKGIVQGKMDFAKAANTYSEDPNSASNGGLVGWFTAPNAALNFEQAVYATPVGGVSQIVRSSIGYHLIQVDAERPARGRIEVSHIFVSADPSDPQRFEIAKKRLEEARAMALSGKPWEEVVRTYSENYKTVARAGKLPPFGINEYDKSFEDAAFALKNIGDLSEPIVTSQGLHLLRLETPANMPVFSEFEDELTKMLAKTSRWKEPKRVFVDQVKAQYGFKEVPNAIQPLLNSEAQITQETLQANPGLQLATFGGTSLNVQTLLDYIKAERLEIKPTASCQFRNQYLEPFFESVLLGFKEAQMPQENPRFRYLVNEYREGILLFSQMDEKVWKRSVRDSSGLEAFFNQHRENYRWEITRFEAWIVNCKDNAAEAEARKLAPNVASGKWDMAKFTEKLNRNFPDNVLVTKGIFAPGEHPVVDAAGEKTGVGPTLRLDNQIRFALITKLLPPQPKVLSEVRGRVISDYATWLEKAWVGELEGKYPVRIDKEVLYRLSK